MMTKDDVVTAAMKFLEAEEANIDAVNADPHDMKVERQTEINLEKARGVLLETLIEYRGS